MRLTFLEADQPLVKSYVRDSVGRLSKTSYPHAWQFSTHDYEVADLADFAAALEYHASRGFCLLKGNTVRVLKMESRAGSTDPNAVTWWLCLDLDRLPGVRSPDEVLGALGLAGVSYVCQYSSSYGIEPEKGLTCHLFFQLSQATLPSALKLWLMWKNLTVPLLTEQIQLTKTHTALSWPLDVTTCQNDKLLYIAPPQLSADVEAPDIKRIEHVVRSSQFLELDLASMPPANKIKALTEAKINALREAIGLEARRFQYKIDKATGLEVLSKCDAATMSGLKRERGFVYFNLNGGDSWGYYHHEDAPEVIRNFKGEPDYLTSDLLPEYWATIKRERKERDIALAVETKQAREAVQSGANDLAPGEKRVLVFRDFHTGLYYNGTWDGTELRLAQAKSETQIQHFLKERGLPEVDFIPTWEVVFDPHSEVRVDFFNRRVNVWKPSDVVPKAGEFPIIRRLIQHAVGTGETERFFENWIACIYRLRESMGTAQILHGVQGTGKGLILHEVLIPLLGREFVVIKRMEELEDSFNGYLENALLTVIDEAQISESKKSRMLMANLKNQITEPYISVRKMRTEARLVRNYNNWMFFSNMPDPVTIDVSDRRFNVGMFQTERLVITSEEVDQIKNELPAYAAHLHSLELDRELARSILDNEDRNRVIQTSKTSMELVAEALQRGNIEMFWEALPSGALDVLPVQQQLMLNEYTNLVQSAVLENKTRFTRDELRVLFEYLCGDMPRTPTKFTQLLRHRNLHIKPMNFNGRTARGIEVEWKTTPEWIEARRSELSVLKPKKEYA